jgi:autotransporter passenger strand-loop-strand repeat protein
VLTGDIVNGVTLLSGAQQNVASGGTASGTIFSGGTETVFGKDFSASVIEGSQIISSGGVALAATIGSDGNAYVEAGGSASGTVISSGGFVFVEVGGAASHTIVSSGGVAWLLGGTTSGTVVSSGGNEDVAGGTARGTVVDSGGVETVYTGTAIGTMVSSGGKDDIAGGVASGAIVRGVLKVTGGTASDATVSRGGIEDVDNGGSATSTTVLSGGHVYVFSGGSIDGATISSGTLVLSSGAVANGGTIDFVSGGTLVLDGTGAYNFLVAGFGVPDEIDLAAINFASATKSYSGNASSGTLMVSDGTHSVSIALLGHYSAASFTLGPESGGGSGTVVTDPPIAAADNPGVIGPTSPHHT